MCLVITFICRKPVAIFNEDQRISSENASKPLLQPSLSLQTMNDNEFQNRFQDETAQSMLERLSRIFEETDVNVIFMYTNNHCIYIYICYF